MHAHSTPFPMVGLSVVILGVAIIFGSTVNSQTTTPNTDAAAKKAAKAAQKEQKALEKAEKTAAKKAENAQKEERNLIESHYLTEAYILVDLSNGDYGGHRAKAMSALNSANKILKVSIAKKGTDSQEYISLRDAAAKAYYKNLRREAPSIIEPQMYSDAQLYQAGQFLTQFRAALTNQPKVLEHVNVAIHELELALLTR